jgi:folylpolyglutamate synthase
MRFSYKDAVQKLNALQSNAALLKQLQNSQLNQKSLPEMRQFLTCLGYHSRDFDRLGLIHISGTKGKGSTSALTQSVLHHYDPTIKTGLFTSPHLVAVRERIRINGKPISEAKFAEYSQQVWEKLKGQAQQPVYFRYLTLLALHTFIQEKVLYEEK